MSELLRTFLAFDLPAGIRREIKGVQAQLKGLIVGDIRWVAPEGIHLTLKFFGEIRGDDVAAVADFVQGAIEGRPPLELTVRSLGVFPDARRPRVIWLGITGDLERLISLQRELEEGLARLGYPAEERAFRPHLTLGRVRSPRGLSGLEAALARRDDYKTGGFRASELTLFRSELTPRGAVYTALCRFPLGGVRV